MNIAAQNVHDVDLLRASLASGRLKPDALQNGERLLQRVTSPVRIAVLGLPDSGKSELLNVLVGRRLVQEDFMMPTLEVRWGEAEQTRLTLQDGSVETHDGLAYDAITASQPALVEFSVPAPFLKNVTLLEPATGTTEQDQAAATKWAARRGDVILWCSQAFAPAERELWAAVPERVKDHSLFVLTKADVLSKYGQLADRMAVLKNSVLDEFRNLLPMSTLQALSAIGEDGTVDETLHIASGARPLMRAIRRQVDSGRQADLDSILMFLNRFDPEALGQKPARSRPVSRQPAPKSQPAEKANTSEATAPAAKAPAQVSKALVYLRDRAADLSDEIRETDASAPVDILDHCNATAEQLVELMSQEDAIPGISALQDDVMDASEMILLMQMEGGARAAADAATLILQIRRGLECKLAA